jgi:threonine/homoserine/homoserine lactone efflux protein
MLSLTALLVFAGALFIAAATPGPNVAALVARVLSKGAGDVLPFLVGLWAGDAVWVTFAVAGLSAIATTFYHAFLVIKWLGILYLLYLAWKMWFTRPEEKEGQLPEAKSAGKLFLTGLALALGNPKIMIFYIALLPSIIDIQSVSIGGWAELVVTLFVVLAIVDFSWVFLAARARTFLKSRRAVRIANRASAGAMAGAAVAIALR